MSVYCEIDQDFGNCSPDDHEDDEESEIEEEEDMLSSRAETGGETDSDLVMASPKSRPQSQLGTIVSREPGSCVII